MNATDAARKTVREYPGGAAALGPRVGISQAVLNSKVNPNTATHHLTFAEAREIVSVTGDDRMLRAWAHEEGFLLVRAPSADIIESDMSVLEQVVSLGMANGQYMAAIHMALADGKVDHEEMKLIGKALIVLQTAAAEVAERLHGMAE
jgi:hypothetical protein